MSVAVWAVVVARTGPTAKSRLSALLGAAERSALARTMLADVLAACRDAGLAGTIAIVDDPVGRRVAEQAGAVVWRDPGGGMNAAVAAGIVAAEARGASAVLVLPGDVPLVTGADLRAVIEAGEPGSAVVVVATDRAGTGTNALFLRPPGIVPPSFEGASAARHLARAAAASATAISIAVDGLSRDVDTPDDVEALRAAGYR